MAGIGTSKLTKIVNEIWLTETFWGIESFKIFKDVGNEQWWLNTMSQVSISTVYSPLPSTLSLFYNPAAFETFTFFNATFVLFLSLFHLISPFPSFFSVFNHFFLHFSFFSRPCTFLFQVLTWAKLGEAGLKSVVPPALSRYIFSNVRYIIIILSDIILINLVVITV